MLISIIFSILYECQLLFLSSSNPSFARYDPPYLLFKSHHMKISLFFFVENTKDESQITHSNLYWLLTLKMLTLGSMFLHLLNNFDSLLFNQLNIFLIFIFGLFFSELVPDSSRVSVLRDLNFDLSYST